MTKELLSLDQLAPELVGQACGLVAVPDPAGGPAAPYRYPLGFVFAQSSPLAVWTITHGLGRYPQVTIVDPSGRQLDADVTYLSANQVVVSGAMAFAGTAYLA